MAEKEHIPTMPQASGAGEHIPTMPQAAGAGEHIPTMPQASGAGEHIPTMPQASGAGEHIPTMPQSAGGHVPTMPQSSGAAGTPEAGPDGHVPTMPQSARENAAGNGKKALLTGPTKFTGDNGGRFIIEGDKPISLDTGEAQIYMCRHENSDERYVAKILVALTPDSYDEKKKNTRRKVIEFLDRYSKDPNNHILPLVDHGELKTGSEKRYVDIYPYCDEGDLSRRNGDLHSIKEITEVVKALASALHCFHTAKLVHRDIKPENLFYYKGDIVIGDFGITCELNTENYAVDREKFGTLGYYAPELNAEAAKAASDYYSMGQTLWTLYIGEMMYYQEIKGHGGFNSPEARSAVYNLQNGNVLLGLDQISKKDEFFEVLIRGLLRYDIKTRFGYEKVSAWLRGDQSLYAEVDMLGDTRFDRPIDINGVKCYSNNDVAVQLSKNWNLGKKLLFDQEEELFKYYYYTLGSPARRKEAEYIRRLKNDCIKQISNSNIGKDGAQVLTDGYLSMVIMFLSGNSLMSWRGENFRNFANLSSRMKEKEPQYYNDMILSGMIEYWYDRMGAGQRSVRAELERARKMFGKNYMGMQTAYYWIQNMLDANRKNLSYIGCATLDAIADKYTESPDMLYGSSWERTLSVEDPKLFGFLCALGYDKAVDPLVIDNIGDYRRQFDLLFSLFENHVKDAEVKKRVRKAYYSFGPWSYLIWLKKNIGEYTFSGSKCIAIRQHFVSVDINSDMTLADQRAAIKKLDQWYEGEDGFRTNFRFNMLTRVAGVSGVEGSDYIYCGKLSGMLSYMFLEHPAPIGFKYEIGI